MRIAKQHEGLARLSAWATCGVDPESGVTPYLVQRGQFGLLRRAPHTKGRVPTIDQASPDGRRQVSSGRLSGRRSGDPSGVPSFTGARDGTDWPEQARTPSMNATIINERFASQPSSGDAHSTCLSCLHGIAEQCARLALHRSTVAIHRHGLRVGAGLVARAAGVSSKAPRRPNRPGTSRQSGFSLWNASEPVLHVGDPRRGPAPAPPPDARPRNARCRSRHQAAPSCAVSLTRRASIAGAELALRPNFLIGLACPLL